jgi:CBS domain-containing protein
MRRSKVKDLMVPFSECATVSQEATLRDAVSALETTRMRYQPRDYRPRVILVYDEHFKVVGTLRHYEVLKALEPKYAKMGDVRAMSRSGLSLDFVRSLVDQYELWAEPFEDLCRKASQVKVKDIMSIPGEGEFIDEDAPLSDAVHRMLLGNHLSLVVTGEKGFLGIIRMSDIFNKVFKEIRQSEM